MVYYIWERIRFLLGKIHLAAVEKRSISRKSCSNLYVHDKSPFKDTHVYTTWPYNDYSVTKSLYLYLFFVLFT